MLGIASSALGLAGWGETFDSSGELHDGETESPGDSPDGGPPRAGEPAFDPRERRGGDARIEGKLFLGDPSLLAELFQKHSELGVRLLTH